MTDCKFDEEVLQEFIVYMSEILMQKPVEDATIKMALLDSFVHIVSNSEDFSISAEQLALWIDVQLDTIRHYLRDKNYGYKEGIDYVVEKIHRTGFSGPKYVNMYFVSIDCFQKICLQTDSKKSQFIRDFFIEVFKQYKEYMLEAISKRKENEKRLNIKTPKENLTINKSPNNYKLGHCVYVVRVKRPNSKLKYKLGRTKNLYSAISRLRHTITGVIDVIFYRMFPDDQYLESCSRSMLRQYWVPDEESTELLETDLHTIIHQIQKCYEHYVEQDSKNLIPTCHIKTPLGKAKLIRADPAALLPDSYAWGPSGVRADERHKLKKVFSINKENKEMK